MNDQKKQRCARCGNQYHTDCIDPKDERDKFDLLRRKWERTPMPNGESAKPPQILYWILAGGISWAVVIFIITLLVLSWTNKANACGDTINPDTIPPVIEIGPAP